MPVPSATRRTSYRQHATARTNLRQNLPPMTPANAVRAAQAPRLGVAATSTGNALMGRG